MRLSAPRAHGEAGAARASGGALFVALAFVPLFLLTQVPIYAVRYPDIDDYPNHFARLFALANLDALPALRDYYVESFGLAPNLATDVLALPLVRAFGELGMKLFASLCTLALATGTVALGFALSGRVTSLALGALLFSFNSYSNLGTFNFVLGTGMALWLIAAWILVGRCARRGPLQFALFTAGTTLLYLCHLAAMGIFLLGVLALECGRKTEPPRVQAFLQSAVFIALMAGPAALIHLSIYQPGINLSAPYPDVQLARLLSYKATLPLALPLVAFDTYPAVMGIATAALVLGLHWGVTRGGFSLSREGMRVMLAIGVAMMVLPPFGFGAAMADVRLGLPLILVLWASIIPPGELPSAFWHRASWCIAACVFMLGSSVLAKWLQADPMHAALRSAMQQMKHGSKVAVVALDRRRPALSPHSVSWSVVDRSAFVSSLFVRPFQPFTLAYREDLASVAALARLDIDASPPAFATLAGKYHHVVIFGAPEETERYAGGAGTLYVSETVRLVRLP